MRRNNAFRPKILFTIRSEPPTTICDKVSVGLRSLPLSGVASQSRPTLDHLLTGRIPFDVASRSSSQLNLSRSTRPPFSGRVYCLIVWILDNDSPPHSPRCLGTEAGFHQHEILHLVSRQLPAVGSMGTMLRCKSTTSYVLSV